MMNKKEIINNTHESVKKCKENGGPGSKRVSEKPSSMRFKRRKGAILAYVIAILTFVAIISAFLASSAVNNLKIIGIVAGQETVQYVSRSAAELGRGILMSEKNAKNETTTSYLEMMKNVVVGYTALNTVNGVAVADPFSFCEAPQTKTDNGNGTSTLAPYFEYILNETGYSNNHSDVVPGYYGSINLTDGDKRIKLWRPISGQMKQDKFLPGDLNYYYGLLRRKSSGNTVFEAEKGEIIGAFCISIGLFAPKPIKDSADVYINVIAFTGAHASASAAAITDSFWTDNSQLKQYIPKALFIHGGLNRDSDYAKAMKADCMRALDNIKNHCLSSATNEEKYRYSIVRCIVPLDAPDKYVFRFMK